MELVNDTTVALVKRFEGLRLKAYKCAAGKWTIGYGNTRYSNGHPVQPGDIISKEDAEFLLRRTLQSFAERIEGYMLRDRVLVSPYTTNTSEYLHLSRFGALVSFAYNVGITGFLKSESVYGKLKEGKWYQVPQGLMLYTKAWSPKKKQLVELNGLVRRRKAEAELYMQPYITMADAMSLTLRPIQTLMDRATRVNKEKYIVNVVESTEKVLYI